MEGRKQVAQLLCPLAFWFMFRLGKKKNLCRKITVAAVIFLERKKNLRRKTTAAATAILTVVNMQ